MPAHQQTPISPQTHLLIAGSGGLLIGSIAFFRLSLPDWHRIHQFSQFSFSERITLLTHIFSPLFSFFLVTGWIWIFFWLGGIIISRRRPPRQQLTQWSHPFKKSSPSRPNIATATYALWTDGEQERFHAIPPFFQRGPILDEIPDSLLVLPFSTPFLGQKLEHDQTVDEKRNVSDKLEEHISQQQETDTGTISTGSIMPPNQPEEHHRETTSSEKYIPKKVLVSTPSEQSEAKTPVTLSFLKHVHVWVHAQDGTTVEVKLRGGENSIRIILLSYIAWHQGESVDRDKMMTHVLSRGRRQDMNTDQLGEAFDAAKKYLRQDLDRAVQTLRKAGHELQQDIDFFQTESGFYWLHPSCSVSDLAQIDTLYQTILLARKEGLLAERTDGSLPEWVIDACQKLIQVYSGDFLQELLKKFPEEVGPWVREPVTRYRDRYLEALLILANYESALGRKVLVETPALAHNEEQSRQHIARAAQLYYDYAMYAINSRWDQKLKFAYRHDKDGERVIMAARAIRRSVVEFGKLGNPGMIDQIYLAFKERMAIRSDGNWKPDADTESDVAAAKSTTSAYRFSSQMANMSHSTISSPLGNR